MLTVVYICVCQSFGTFCNTAYERAANSNKRPPTIPFGAECFQILNHFPTFCSLNEVIIFFFRLYFDGFRTTARETGDPIDTTQLTSSTDADTALPASLLLAGVVCLPQTTNEALPWSCCHRQADGGGSSGDEAVSLVVCIVEWSVLTVNIMHTSAWSARMPSAHHL